MRNMLLIAAIVASLILASTATADELMTFKEVEECIALDHTIITADSELAELKNYLEEELKELTSTKNSMDSIRNKAESKKKKGEIDDYNTLVKTYNDLIADYNSKHDAYEAKLEKHKSINDEQRKRKLRFEKLCDNRKFHKPDLRKACRESEHPETPFCAENIKKIDKQW